MGKLLDKIPVVSQAKSAIQAISGDTEGARRTQETFVNSAPVIAQAKSAFQAMSGDTEGARRTQEAFVENNISRLKEIQSLPSTIIRAATGIQDYRALPTSTSLTPRSKWMDHAAVRAKKLHELLIPGTHDSVSYKFKDYIPVALKFAQAQNQTVSQQLEGGIRYLDIRVMKRKADGILYCSHMFETVPFGEVLNEVKAFLDAYPTEKVIFNVHHDGDAGGSGDDTSVLNEAKTAADRLFQDKYVEKSNLMEPLENWDTHAILYLRDNYLDLDKVVVNSWKGPDILDEVVVISSIGPNDTESMIPEDAVHKCINWAKSRQRTSLKLNLLACQATMAGKAYTILDTLQNDEMGLEHLAGRANHVIGHELLTDAKAILGANVINMDYANDLLIDRIISMNLHVPTVTIGFQRVPGAPALVQLAVGSRNSVWGLNDSGRIFHSDGQTWQPIPGVLKEIAAAADGSVWGVTASQQIYRWTGKSWELMPGGAVKIAIQNSNSVWGLNASGIIYHWDGQTWGIIPGGLKEIAAAADGTAWGVNASGKIWCWTGKDWQLIPGDLTMVKIANGGIHSVWGLDASQNIYHYDEQSKSIVPIQGSLVEIAAAADGSVWGLDASHNVCRFVMG